MCLAPDGGSAGWGDWSSLLCPSALLLCHFCLAAVNAAQKIKVQTCFVSDAIPRNNFPGKMNSVSFFFSFSLGILEKFQCVGGGKQSRGCKQELILSPALNGERN